MKIKSTLSRNLAIIVIFIAASSYSYSQSPGILKQKYDKQEVYITMRDGVRLFTSIYTPKNTSVAHPILMNRTPYNIEPGGPDSFNYFMQLYNRYTADDYIMVFQDVRGRYMSEGEFEDIRPVIPLRKSNKDTDESTDTWDTVDWLIKNVKNNNGNVGMFGISYPGFYSTMGIINAHPAVKAVSPQAPVTAWFLAMIFTITGLSFFLIVSVFITVSGNLAELPHVKEIPGLNGLFPTAMNFFLMQELTKILLRNILMTV